MRLPFARGPFIEQEERRDLYIYGINYCALRIPRGDRRFTNLALELYEAGIADRSLFEGNYLSHWTYTNVVKLSLNLQRYQWTEQFIEQFHQQLTPAFREDALHYNLAELYYQKGDLERVLDNLRKLHFSDLHYHLGSRILLLKTYYMRAEQEALESLLSSFTAFLRRNSKVSDNFREACLNFCTLLQQIHRGSPRDFAELSRKLDNTQPLVQREWLAGILAGEP